MFVLLVGAVNVTNLMLVRSSARMKELATRHALGAGLGRIARQLADRNDAARRWPAGRSVSRSAMAGVRALAAFGLDSDAAGHAGRRSTRTVIAFTFGLAVALALLIGLIPIVSLRQMNLSQSLPRRGALGHRQPRRARDPARARRPRRSRSRSCC